MEAGETGRVVRVIDGDALVLDTGQSVRLVSIEAPALRPRGREPDSYAVEASRALEDMAMGRQVRLYYPGLTRDRYDRALAHVVTVDGAGPELWLNRDLIRQGAARVRLYPDTAMRGEDLLALEAQARADKAGLWAKSAYKVKRAEEIDEADRGVLIVSAELAETIEADAGACRWRLMGASLTVLVEDNAADFCRVDPGGRYEVRGWVSDGQLRLTHALHAQVLE